MRNHKHLIARRPQIPCIRETPTNRILYDGGLATLHLTLAEEVEGIAMDAGQLFQNCSQALMSFTYFVVDSHVVAIQIYMYIK